ncbi:MAG TPA: hypothetical protein PLX20_05390 [Rhodocyclaceae bacterium]|nr:hypothetical protein [Rhodocyclaceae bacterium]HNB79239.1 hypothetical protein [Rhodocyclaceae bacterium]HNC61702.1 hypothetical protein [Rhodocyclaceae bacterium]HNH12544.1 hypothetical protein [Rhodocyclaceae bacterium]HNI00274.1 hypothetical protein [Rhodocyclaceae bacterium]
MSLSLFNAVVDARNNVASGFGLEEACRLAAAEHRQDVARVALLTADALIAQAQAKLALAGGERRDPLDGGGDE